ncbi:MAG: carboxylesterase [Gallionella sp.]
MSAILPHITLESGKNPQHSIIWLHGLGADGEDFVPIADELKLPYPVRYIFPHAPQRAVTINGGLMMRAWYDIVGFNVDAQQDAAGIRASQIAVEALIGQEISRGISPGNIFLAGFSQGGAIALHTALHRNTPLGGVLALSTYLPLMESVIPDVLTSTTATPTFMAHGRSDPVIPYAWGVTSRNVLRKFGYAVEWHEYAMQHSVCEEELRDIATWLTKKLG